MCSDAHLKYKYELDLKTKQEEMEKVEKGKADWKEAAAIKERERSSKI